MLRLVIEDGEGTTHVVPLIRDEITIGRQEGNTIRLTERNVSRCHARLTKAGTEETPTVFVEDLDSYNGIKVNGDRILGKCTLQPDDTIQIGDYFLALEEQTRSTPVSSQEMVIELEEEPPREPTAERLDDSQRARFIVVSSNLAGEIYDLKRRETLIGRTATDENDVIINHRSISRNHVKVIWRDGGFTVIDLASANGILVNGQATSTATLVNGDIIEMGHVKLRFSGPGDTYEFTLADIDDVVLPPRSSTIRMVVMTSFLAAVGVAAYVVVDSASNQPDEQATQVKTAPSATAPAKSDNKAENKVIAVKPNLPTQPAVLNQGANEVLALLEEGEKYLDQKKWDEAIGIFQRILQSSPNNRLAIKRIRRANREMKYRLRLQELRGHVRGKRWMQAQNSLAAFDRQSIYFGDAQAYDKKIQAGIEDVVETPYQDGRTALRGKRLERARKAVRVLDKLAQLKYPRALKRSAEIRAGIERLEKAAPVAAVPKPARVGPRKKRTVRVGPTKVVVKAPSSSKPVAVRKPSVRVDPKKKTYTSLLKEARELAFGPRHKEANVVARVKDLLTQAIRQAPNRSEAYFRMCMVLRRRKQFRSALTYCRDAAKRAGPVKRKQLESFIKTLEQSAGN